MASSVVALRGADKRYARGERWVLRRVDAGVTAGATIEVRGANGAGKSTLLRLLAGATAPTRGRRVAERGLVVGYAPDRLAPPPFAAAAYLRHHARLRALRARDGEAQAAELAERLGFAALLGERLAALSKGSLQKVVLAQALLGAPGLLVLDEPFSGLDAEAQRALAALAAERAAAGAAVVLTDHRGGPDRPRADATWRLEGGGVHEVPGGAAPGVGPPGGAAPAIALPGVRRSRLDGDRLRVVADPARSDAALAALLAREWHVVRVGAATDGGVEIEATRGRER